MFFLQNWAELPFIVMYYLLHYCFSHDLLTYTDLTLLLADNREL